MPAVVTSFKPQLPPARGLATMHPSSVLRAQDRGEAYRAFAADLQPLASL